MASLGTITAVGLESGGIYIAAVYYSAEVAERANWICGMVTAIIYVAINILLFVPAMRCVSAMSHALVVDACCCPPQIWQIWPRPSQVSNLKSSTLRDIHGQSEKCGGEMTF